MVVHQLPEVLEPGPFVERDRSTSRMNLDTTTPGGSCEVEQGPNYLGTRTRATMRLLDVHRLDVSVNTVKVARCRNPGHQREKAHADGLTTVRGNDRSKTASLA